MRAFIAIELPPEIRSALGILQQELKKYGADIRWVKPDNIHLTLKFLGEVEEDRIERITAGIEDVCSRHGRLRLEVKGLGVFPNRRSPRVLWADVRGDGLLTGLHRDMEKAMSSAGFKADKRGFTPHLTLGRFRSLREKDHFIEGIDRIGDSSIGLMDVRSVAMMSSKLGPSGAEYTRVTEAPLQEDG